MRSRQARTHRCAEHRPSWEQALHIPALSMRVMSAWSPATDRRRPTDRPECWTSPKRGGVQSPSLQLPPSLPEWAPPYSLSEYPRVFPRVGENHPPLGTGALTHHPLPYWTTGPGPADQRAHRPRGRGRTTRPPQHSTTDPIEEGATDMAAPVSTLRSVCSDCGSAYEREDSGSRCPECKPTRERTAQRIVSESRRGTAKSRGYDAAWTRLSKRARRLQPFCSDCGREDNLSTDHSPRAWARREAGLPVRLEDVDVVCLACNAERGPARGPDAVERQTIADHRRDLSELEDGMPDDLDQRVARGEL